MNTSRMSLTFVIFFILAGCQQTQPTAGKPVTQDTFLTDSQQKDDGPSDSSNAYLENIPSPIIAKKESAPELTPQASEPKARNTNQTLSEDVQKNIDQKKIDQALEFCNFAQDMWEKGNIEDAIAHLDSAYYLILEINHLSEPELSQQKEDLRYLISKRILEIYASRQIVVTGKHEVMFKMK